MIQLDTDQLLSAAQQIEITKLSVVSMLISIMLMFSITVFALIVFGRKSSRHAAEREKLNEDWQATIKDVAKQLTEDFTPLVNTIGQVVLAVGALQRDITGSVDGLSTSVGSVTTQVGTLVEAVNKLSKTMEDNDAARQKRYDELFSRETDTALRIGRIELALGGVQQSIDELGRKVVGSATLAPEDSKTLQMLIDAANTMLSRYGEKIERLKEVQHETSGNDLPSDRSSDPAADDGTPGAGAGNAGADTEALMTEWAGTSGLDETPPATEPEPTPETPIDAETPLPDDPDTGEAMQWTAYLQQMTALLNGALSWLAGLSMGYFAIVVLALLGAVLLIVRIARGHVPLPVFQTVQELAKETVTAVKDLSEKRLEEAKKTVSPVDDAAYQIMTTLSNLVLALAGGAQLAAVAPAAAVTAAGMTAEMLRLQQQIDELQSQASGTLKTSDEMAAQRSREKYGTPSGMPQMPYTQPPADAKG